MTVSAACFSMIQETYFCMQSWLKAKPITCDRGFAKRILRLGDSHCFRCSFCKFLPSILFYFQNQPFIISICDLFDLLSVRYNESKSQVLSLKRLSSKSSWNTPSVRENAKHWMDFLLLQTLPNFIGWKTACEMWMTLCTYLHSACHSRVKLVSRWRTLIEGVLYKENLYKNTLFSKPCCPCHPSAKCGWRPLYTGTLRFFQSCVDWMRDRHFKTGSLNVSTFLPCQDDCQHFSDGLFIQLKVYMGWNSKHWVLTCRSPK